MKLEKYEDKLMSLINLYFHLKFNHLNTTYQIVEYLKSNPVSRLEAVFLIKRALNIIEQYPDCFSHFISSLIDLKFSDLLDLFGVRFKKLLLKLPGSVIKSMVDFRDSKIFEYRKSIHNVSDPSSYPLALLWFLSDIVIVDKAEDVRADWPFVYFSKDCLSFDIGFYRAFLKFLASLIHYIFKIDFSVQTIGKERKLPEQVINDVENLFPYVIIKKAIGLSEEIYRLIPQLGGYSNDVFEDMDQVKSFVKSFIGDQYEIKNIFSIHSDPIYACCLDLFRIWTLDYFSTYINHPVMLNLCYGYDWFNFLFVNIYENTEAEIREHSKNMVRYLLDKYCKLPASIDKANCRSLDLEFKF